MDQVGIKLHTGR